MPSHTDLATYDSRPAATAAARVSSHRRIPYRVWRCGRCDTWHAAPWTEQTPPGVSDPDDVDTTVRDTTVRYSTSPPPL
jgi:ribosomal protein L37AE/L43A